MNIAPAYTLPHIPAFGFENLDRAVAARTDLWITRLSRIDTIYNKVVPNSANPDPMKFIKPIAIFYTILGTSYFTVTKVMGYIPINSILLGFYRIIYVVALAIFDAIGACATGDPKPTIANKKWHILRGLMEIACCGPILLLIDIIVTRIRSQWKSQEDVVNHPWLVL